MLSPKTVRNHVSNILDKLRAADRAEAILRAREAWLQASLGGANQTGLQRSRGGRASVGYWSARLQTTGDPSPPSQAEPVL